MNILSRQAAPDHWQWGSLAKDLQICSDLGLSIDVVPPAEDVQYSMRWLPVATTTSLIEHFTKIKRNLNLLPLVPNKADPLNAEKALEAKTILAKVDRKDYTDGGKFCDKFLLEALRYLYFPMNMGPMHLAILANNEKWSFYFEFLVELAKIPKTRLEIENRIEELARLMVEAEQNLDDKELVNGQCMIDSFEDAKMLLQRVRKLKERKDEELRPWISDIWKEWDKYGPKPVPEVTS